MDDFVRAEHVFLNNPATSVDEALSFLSRQAVALGIAEREDEVKAAFEAREREGATGMMEGFSIPHAKSDVIKEPAVCVVRYAHPISEWESLDDEPIAVSVALLVPGGEAGTTHIKLLSQVAVMLMDEAFRDAMMTMDDEELIAQTITMRLER